MISHNVILIDIAQCVFVKNTHSLTYSSALISNPFKVGEDTWHCWCFETEIDDEYQAAPWCHLPRFHRVRKLTLKEHDGKKFIHCSCAFYDRTGIPCPHFFYIVDEIELNMIHVRYWKVYHAHYNENSELGKELVRAQQQHFDCETMGIQVSDDTIRKARLSNGQTSFPIFFLGTTTEDYNEALFVLDSRCCRYHHMVQYKKNREGDSDSDSDNDDCMYASNDETTLANLAEQDCMLSNTSQRMQEEIEQSQKSGYLQTDDEKAATRKNCITAVDSVLNSSRLSQADKEDFEQQVIKLKDKLFEKAAEEYGAQGGGDGVFQWSGERGRREKKQTRKPMSLDFH